MPILCNAAENVRLSMRVVCSKSCLTADPDRIHYIKNTLTSTLLRISTFLRKSEYVDADEILTRINTPATTILRSLNR